MLLIAYGVQVEGEIKELITFLESISGENISDFRKLSQYHRDKAIECIRNKYHDNPLEINTVDMPFDPINELNYPEIRELVKSPECLHQVLKLIGVLHGENVGAAIVISKLLDEFSIMANTIIYNEREYPVLPYIGIELADILGIDLELLYMMSASYGNLRQVRRLLELNPQLIKIHDKFTINVFEKNDKFNWKFDVLEEANNLIDVGLTPADDDITLRGLIQLGYEDLLINLK